jgi:hypothetical protein
MTLRVARIYFWVAVLALLGSFGAAMLVAPEFVLGEGIAVVLIALVGLAWWAIGGDRAWGLLLWALVVLLVAVPFLIAGVPHSGSITSTEYGTGRIMTDHFEQPGSRGWLSLGLAHLLLAALGLIELAARLRRRDPRLGARLAPSAATPTPPVWAWGATVLGAVLLGWVDRVDGGPVVPLGLLTVACMGWGAVRPDRWWVGGLLLGAGLVAGEVLRLRALGWTAWRGEEAWSAAVILVPAVLGTYAGVALRAAVERRRRPQAAEVPG